ncbi:hypothetical protein H6F90_12950 [Trichocoleus sp. FACHB-591]|uniref:hypothetical protein n=1 Tax=Trichocoleus sp. FACHB-591 TaxID=2692872 RepID=UPI0016826B09|nr:hypothetical protein [Trichocoleus sp. FACHB-591]MBD2096052.1 hypothetical protein [Trichocoleus sp. FACHB-591]
MNKFVTDVPTVKDTSVLVIRRQPEFTWITSSTSSERAIAKPALDRLLDGAIGLVTLSPQQESPLLRA